MELLKKHMISFICGGVALLAIGITFFPMGGMFEGLSTQMQESEKDDEEIKSLINQRVNFPSEDPTKAVVACWPSEKALTAAKSVVQRIADDSADLMDRVVRLNAGDRKLLVPGSLPAGAELGAFKNRYPQFFAELRSKLNAAVPVTDAEVDAEMPKPAETGAAPAAVSPPMGRPGLDARGSYDSGLAARERARISRGGGYTENTNERMEVRARLAQERANSFSMYLTPDPQSSIGTSSFAKHPGIPEPTVQDPPTVPDVWVAQLGLWIQQDVCDAIAGLNGNSKKVGTSIVKRLVSIEIPPEYITKTGPTPIVGSTDVVRPGRGGIMRGNFGGAGDQNVTGPTNAPVKPLFRDYTWSPTGRICNSMYDVMHFYVTVDVDAACCADVLWALENNRCITVLNVDSRAVDLQTWQDAGYFYGDRPVVQLVIKCEALFFRQWTVVKNGGVMPEVIREQLGAKTQKTTLTPGGGN